MAFVVLLIPVTHVVMPVSVITVNKELNSTNTELIFGGIGVFYKEDSIDTQGGTVQVRTSERIIRAE